MDDDPFTSLTTTTIFEGADSFGDFAQKVRPIKPEIGFDDAGIQCELKHLDSVYNGKGERVLLRTGNKFHVEKDRSPDAYHSALVRTQFWSRDGEEEQIELEIRSPHMKAALKAVIPEFEKFPIDLKHIKITNEPRCLFHYRDQLFAFGANLDPGTDAISHISFLLEYMQQELSAEIYSWTVMVELEIMPISDTSNPSLEFANLWMAFKPGDLIYIPCDKPNRPVDKIWQFVSMSKDCKCSYHWCVRSHYWAIRGHYIDYDGERFGYDDDVVHIRNYEGYRSLKDLAVVPLQYHPDRDRIKESHISRGRKFVNLRGRHDKHYKGPARILGKLRDTSLCGENDNFPIQTTWINGRVIIDCEAFCESRSSHAIELLTNKTLEKEDSCSVADFTNDELVICHYQVQGFVLKEKRWAHFNVDNFSEIHFDDNVFTSSLRLRPQMKNMILSLVKVHENENARLDDVISGKGKGMVFLLHGEPGVGKTLTAESVADYCKKPLLRIDASVLGTSAESVEANLDEAFRLAERWKCIILLDEADVFLEQRTSSDLQRNSLVAVFLRILEYYEGIMFLTTNRLDTFDPAFKSRVHLAVHFPKLDAVSRKSIWKTFLLLACNGHYSPLTEDYALNEFASVELNGRQIKNVMRIAKARAESEGKPITKEFVNEALDAMKDFDGEIDERVRRLSPGDDEVVYQGNTKKRRIGM